MKRLLLVIVAFVFIGIIFNSCKKDDSLPSNYITIEGSFTIGDRTYSNQTFNLGEPTDNMAYYSNPQKSPLYSEITIKPALISIDIGNTFRFYYTFNILSTEVGDAEMSGWVQVFSTNDAYTAVNMQGVSVLANITKIEPVGGYIEGTFEGYFSLEKKDVTPYFLKGKFKVKHIAGPLGSIEKKGR